MGRRNDRHLTQIATAIFVREQSTGPAPVFCLRNSTALLDEFISLQDNALWDSPSVASARRPSVSGQQKQGAGGSSRMSREWGEFMEASKVSQVKDVWDVKGADMGHKASKKQLEEMTARFRSASSAGGS